MANTSADITDLENLDLSGPQIQLLLQRHDSIYEAYLNIMKQSLQDIGLGLVVNMFFYSIANYAQVINDALIHIFHLEAWWHPCIALSLAYLMLELALFIYDRFLSPHPYSHDARLSEILLRTMKFVGAGMITLYLEALYTAAFELTGLNIWQLSMVVAAIYAVVSVICNVTRHYNNTMNEPSEQYQPTLSATA